MNELPDLPFKLVLSYLSLEDRLKSRAVSRAWKMTIDRFRVKSLCCSNCPRDFIEGKDQWVSGTFAQNFISSSRIGCFFGTFGRSILSNLKYLRLCDLDLNFKNVKTFVQTLRSLDQLEQFDMIRSHYPFYEFELNLPMLKSIRLDRWTVIRSLTLEAPRLQKVKFELYSPQTLNIVHRDSVELLFTCNSTHARGLKNLKQLYYYDLDEIDPTLLSDLEQLKEIYLESDVHVAAILEQKRRYARTDLKVCFAGLLLTSTEYLSQLDIRFNKEATFRCLAENQSRLADEIPFCDTLYYTPIECVARLGIGLKLDIVNRFTGLNEISVYSRIVDVPSFLGLLKNLTNIFRLDICGDQPQELFDRLPEHSAVQNLVIRSKLSDFRFLLRLKNLINLQIDQSIDAESTRKALEELPFLTTLEFLCVNVYPNHWNRRVSIQIDRPKRFEVSVCSRIHYKSYPAKKAGFTEPDAAVQFAFSV